MADAGIRYPRVLGGYKAMRTFLLRELEKSLQASDIVLIAGRTGTGKTRVVEHLRTAVDLEGLANHRGSAFGHLTTPQPSQIDFENGLSIALMRILACGISRVFFEDEGRLIGRISLPDVLRQKMASAPMLIVEQSIAERVDVVLEDYVQDLGRRYWLLDAQNGPALHRDKLLSDLARISRRLGGERYKRVVGMMNEAFDQQWATGDATAHCRWISFLLERYYDPMYDHQLQQRNGQVLMRGDRQAVIQWAQENS